MSEAPATETTDTDHAGSTAERILAALVEVILEGGLPGFSVQEVADRAGVSHRTVYRHFPSRESLLEGLSEMVDRRMSAHGGVGADELGTVDDLPAAAIANFTLFSRDERAVEASVRFGVGAAIETPDRLRRTDRFRELLAESLPTLSAADVAMAGALLRQILSTRAWLGVREAGLDGDASARVATWAAAVLIDALRAGRTPTSEPVPAPRVVEEPEP